MAVITATVATTTHPRILNRSLVACDAAGAPVGRLWWLLLDGRFMVTFIVSLYRCFVWICMEESFQVELRIPVS